MEENKKSNSSAAIIVILSILLILTTGYIVYKEVFLAGNSSNAKNNIPISNETTNNQNEAVVNGLGKDDTFTTSTNSGIVEVIGYPEKKEITNITDGTKHTYIYFHIKETKSTEFKKYIESINGNSYVSNNSIGIGCVSDGIIKYTNDSDSARMKNYELSQEDSDKILNATESNPIKLKLEKALYTGGVEAPICYSHITKIMVQK